MRITLIFLFCIVFLFACRAKTDDSAVIPPETSPLSGEYIGYGVITDSFTHVTADPSEDSISLGYLRRGSLVRIVRRQIVKTQTGGFQTWILTDEPQYGWLKEDVMGIYATESQAKTASLGLGN